MKLRSIRSSESASGDAVRPGVSAETARLLPLLVPVTLSASAALVAAAVSFGLSQPTLGVMGGVLALAVAATFVEAYPVPIEGIASGGVSLTAVFIVGAAVIYGWAPAVMIGFVARATIELVQRRPAIRLAYNSAVYALAGGAGGAAAALVGAHNGVGGLFVQVLFAGAAFYAVNILLTAPTNSPHEVIDERFVEAESLDDARALTDSVVVESEDVTTLGSQTAGQSHPPSVAIDRCRAPGVGEGDHAGTGRMGWANQHAEQCLSASREERRRLTTGHRLCVRAHQPTSPLLA